MKTANSLYPISLHEFVLILKSENADHWGEQSLDWIVDKLSQRKDNIFYHKSASASSLSDFVKKKRISLSGKVSHCDVQYYIWKLNTNAGNDKSPIDSLWTDNKVRCFRKGTYGFHIDRNSFITACEYAIELSKRPFRRTGRGVICPAKDGCFCRSLDEVCIDDWLYDNGFYHEKEPNYPKDPILNKRGRKKADWKVGETLIEYAGLMGDKAYENKLKDKIELAQTYKINLIILVKGDLLKLDEKLKNTLDKS